MEVSYEKIIYLLLYFLKLSVCNANDILGCGGFVKSHVNLDFSKVEIGLYTKQGSLKEKTECAPTNGYYFLPLYDKGEYVLKVQPPAGWSFEPSEVELTIDGESDQCSIGQDINFAFNGFGITGKVITAGQKQGPSGVNVQLVTEKGDVRNTDTTSGGNFHFTPVIPGKYTVKASHPRWKLEPSQAEVLVKEGNTALPFGVLVVKGYDVTGSIISFGSPISGLYVLLYSKEDPKFRVEGCNTALLQDVPDSPICHSITDNSGEFKFGVVPAGEYTLMVLATPPGQVAVTYNVKPDNVAFTVQHDSLYIKNAFEVTGFTMVGTVQTTAGGDGVPGVRVVLDGKPVGKTDAAGKFTLVNMQPGNYALNFEHELSEFEEVSVQVGATGPRRGVTARPARWRVCGAVRPAPRTLTLAPTSGAHAHAQRRLHTDADGNWCTFLPPGEYTASVEVTEQEQTDGLQFYPTSQRLVVAQAALQGVAFSQLKGRVRGRLRCRPGACRRERVALRPLQPDGSYRGPPRYTTADDGGEYAFEEVLPGSVEVSVSGERLCWAETRHNVAVAQELAVVPDFEQRGYVVRVHASHPLELEYAAGPARGLLAVPRGASAQCLERAAVYTLTPRGCHRFQPPAATVDTAAPELQTVHFVAVAHAVVIKVLSPEAVDDLVLSIDVNDRGAEDIGPLEPVRRADGGFAFEHTLYMADGEAAEVSARSGSLLVAGGARRVTARGECQPAALTLRAVRGLTLAARLRPPVAGATVTLTDTTGAVKLSRVTGPDGAYSFGPLDASLQYTVSAEKDSYVFSAPDAAGDIEAHKLADISVLLLDDADSRPLQGALVSVSGGPYRRNAASGEDGRLRFGSLSPAQYYVKPHMKEYRFTPPHHIVPLLEGTTHNLTIRGTRVAWSCVGRVQSLAGAPWGGAALQARAAPAAPDTCAPAEAVADAEGHFRIRGLLPECVYTIELKESTVPELAGLKLVEAPPTIEVRSRRDVTGVRLLGVQRAAATDVHVRVRARDAAAYRALRVSLAAGGAPQQPQPPLYSARAAPALALPRLAADNGTYVLRLECSLSKATHHYDDVVHHFVSDGRYKSFTIDFFPKVKSNEQDVRQTSLLLVPLLVCAALGWQLRGALGPLLAPLLAALLAALGPRARARRPPEPAAKRAPKKKAA